MPLFAALCVPLWLAACTLGAGTPATATPPRISTTAPAGALTTVAGAGASKLYGPAALALDAAGNLYIADASGNRVYKLSPSGTLAPVAGDGTSGFAGDGGPARAARLANPTGLAVDAAGNVYVADTDNNRVRRVRPDGTISTFAGTGVAGYSGDGGLATAAQLLGPSGLALDAAGALYVADSLNNAIRKVGLDGIITAFAGGGGSGSSGDGGPALAAHFFYPQGIAFDDAGALYIVDSVNNRVRRVAGGTITLVAGTGTPGYSGDGGPAPGARLTRPTGIAVRAGAVYIADTLNYSVRKVSAGGTISTVVGDPTSYTLLNPTGLALDRAGNLYIADGGHGWVREIHGPI